MKKLIIYLIIIGCADNEKISYDSNNNIGTLETLDIITWNIQNFPKNSVTTIQSVADIINNLNVDVIALQEIENENAFNSLIYQLGENWIGYRSGSPSSAYGELSYLINTDFINIFDIYTILDEEEYYFSYRSPYVLEISFNNKSFVIINNHFKCCGDGILDLNNYYDEENRRFIATQLLHEYINNYYNQHNVIILGDLNDSITDIENENVFMNILNDEYFLFTDTEIAYGSSSNWSYPTWPSHIDHIIITNELFSEFSFEESYVTTLKIDEDLDGGWLEYEQNISDHRPLLLSLKMED